MFAFTPNILMEFVIQPYFTLVYLFGCTGLCHQHKCTASFVPTAYCRCLPVCVHLYFCIFQILYLCISYSPASSPRSPTMLATKFYVLFTQHFGSLLLLPPPLWPFDLPATSTRPFHVTFDINGTMLSSLWQGELEQLIMFAMYSYSCKNPGKYYQVLLKSFSAL